MMQQQSNFSIESAMTQFKLANVWHVRGHFKKAFARYQEVLRLQPDYVPAYEQLGNLMLKQRHVEEALEYYEKALAIDFEAVDLSFYYKYLGLSHDPNSASDESENIAFGSQLFNANGKINLGNQRVFRLHRSGWNFAIQALVPLHNPQGVLFDGFLEHKFLYDHCAERPRSQRMLEKVKADGLFQRLKTLGEQGITPYQVPWVGCLHHPPAIPKWFNQKGSPQVLFENPVWQESLSHCLGLFVLSEYHATWLRERTNLPVSVLIHPTEIPEKQFNFQQFLANPCKKIVQIGWWIRKFNSLYQLPIAQDNALGYQKMRLKLGWLESLYPDFMRLEAEIYRIKIDPAYFANTIAIQRLPNDQYDDLLATNIAFVDLHDSSANNAVIECIARATPLLINPLPAVKEYLGQDYPMYFHSLEEAAEKALDTSLILETHQYLKSCETRQKLSGDYFLKNFCKSEVYQNL